MLDLRAPALDEYQRMLKRGFDLIATALLLIPFLPLMILIGLLILLVDGWPVLFFQKRVGENGRLFNFHQIPNHAKRCGAIEKRYRVHG